MKRAWLLAVLLGVTCIAHAHEPSLAYLTLNAQDDRIEGRLDVAVRDLEDAVGLDADGDRAITWAEFQARRAAVLDYAQARLSIGTAAGLCELSFSNDSLDKHGEAPFAVIGVVGSCAGVATGLTIDYGLVFDVDATHRALFELSAGGRTTSAVLSSDASKLALTLEDVTGFSSLRRFFVEGVRHIWQGYDHLVFLGLLLFPAVLRRAANADAERPVAVIASVAWIVTAFTLAHSLTLGLAVYGIVDLPPGPVEAVIAASIVIAGLINLMPNAVAMGPTLAFGFGLVHGLGFANALRGLGEGSAIWSLVGFNLGVELGQLVAVGVALPILFGLRRTAGWRQPVLVMSSVACSAVGLVWLVQRLA